MDHTWPRHFAEWRKGATKRSSSPSHQQGAKLTSFRVIAPFCEKLPTYLAKNVAFAPPGPTRGVFGDWGHGWRSSAEILLPKHRPYGTVHKRERASAPSALPRLRVNSYLTLRWDRGPLFEHFDGRRERVPSCTISRSSMHAAWHAISGLRGRNHGPLSPVAGVTGRPLSSAI